MKTIHLMMSVYLPSDEAHPTETTKVSHAAQVWYSTPEQLQVEIDKAQARLAAWAKKVIATFEDIPNAG